MTDLLFFDCDCISAFLWVKEQALLPQLYPGKIVIPRSVYDELSYPTTPHLKQRIDYMVAFSQAKIADIEVGTEEHALFLQLTTFPASGHKIIGPGEAAAITLAKCHGGIVASNNLRDICAYTEEFKLKHITTGDILLVALNRGLITEDVGNTIWASMLSKRRKLGASSFSEYKSQTSTDPVNGSSCCKRC